MCVLYFSCSRYIGSAKESDLAKNAGSSGIYPFQLLEASIFPFSLLLWGETEFVAIYQIVLLPELQRPQITESTENYLFFFLVEPLQCMWDLSSLTREQTHSPCSRGTGSRES